MNPTIDDKLDEVFTPCRVKEVFAHYLESKWDKLTPKQSPAVNIPLGADGVTHEAFAKQLDRHAHNICRRISEGSYTFYPFREVEVKKERTAPDAPQKFRKLSIACIRDVIVQNILYHNVLYTPIEEIFRTLDNPRIVSFAYRKGRSAPQAAQAIHSYIKAGYVHVFDADLKQYFDTIPHKPLLAKVAAVINDERGRTFQLINRFIHTDKVPYHTYRNACRRGKHVGHKIFHWRKPQRVPRSAGVPQGGVLSGMLANLYLHEFDEWIVHALGIERDIRYVRYADDFIILSKQRESLDDFKRLVTDKLSSETLNLRLNEDKTDTVDVRDRQGLNFVGFHFDSDKVRVRKKNIKRYKNRIMDIVWPRTERSDSSQQPQQLQKTSEARIKHLACRIKYKVQGLSGEKECYRCGCQRVSPPRSWMAFFSGVTDVAQLHELDRWTREVLWAHAYHIYGIRLSRRYLKQIGLKSLVNEYYQIRTLRLQPCVCDLERDSLWRYARDLYEGREFFTLARQAPFRVLAVNDSDLQIRTPKLAVYRIRKDVMTEQWHKLYSGETISRQGLENEGVWSVSQVVTLLAKLPGVTTSLQPIELKFDRPEPWTGLDLLSVDS